MQLHTASLLLDPHSVTSWPRIVCVDGAVAAVVLTQAGWFVIGVEEGASKLWVNNSCNNHNDAKGEENSRKLDPDLT
jgi:hypothetical protein